MSLSRGAARPSSPAKRSTRARRLREALLLSLLPCGCGLRLPGLLRFLLLGLQTGVLLLEFCQSPGLLLQFAANLLQLPTEPALLPIQRLPGRIQLRTGGGQRLLDVSQGSVSSGPHVDRFLDGGCDRRQRTTTIDEVGDRHFVGGVEHCRHLAAGAKSRPRQAEGGERLLVRRLEGLGQIQAGKLSRKRVVEEGEPYMEEAVKAFAQERGLSLPINGKGPTLFSRLYEFDPAMVRQKMADYFGIACTPPVVPSPM